MKKATLLLVAFAVAVPLTAQETMPSSGPDALATMKGNYNYVKSFILQSAEDMPEADFAFKPTPEVRSFGQLLAHTADANYMICSTVLGKESPSKGVEKNMTSKADIQKALAASYDYCQAAFSIPEKDMGAKVSMFGQEMSRMGALLIDVTHNWEHYGNLVTYLRMKGHVPPSSKPARM